MIDTSVAIEWSHPRGWFRRPSVRLLKDLHVLDITIPRGFVSDGFTVDFLAWWLLPPLGKGLQAAILHDYLLEIRPAAKASRRFANGMFYKALRECGISWVRAKAIYFLVQIYSKQKGEL